MLERRSVLVAGGTGFIGSALCDRLEAGGAEVAVLTRVPHERAPGARRVPGQEAPEGSSAAGGGRRYVLWRPEDPASAASVIGPELERASAVVNLAGAPVVAGRWSARVKERILESRLAATRAVVQAMKNSPRRPGVLVNASAVGYYGLRVDRPAAEDAPPGEDFLADVCRRWEEEALKAEALGVRVARLRIGVVLGNGGALAKMLTPFRLGLGGTLGSGDQPMSWVHIGDLVELILWAIENPAAQGPFNATAPNPVTNREFSRILARVLRRPCLLPVPGFMLRLLLGEVSSMLLEGQNAPPQAAQAYGFRFRFALLEGALRDLLAPGTSAVAAP